MYKFIHKVFENFLIKLLFDHRLNEFHEIAETEQIIKYCSIKIDRRFENCLKIDNGIHLMNGDLYLTSYLNRTEYNKDPKFEKVEEISTEFYPSEEVLTDIYLSHSLYFSKDTTWLKINAKTKIIYSTFTTEKMSENECIDDKNIAKYGEEYFVQLIVLRII
jgi:hypothetical protein